MEPDFPGDPVAAPARRWLSASSFAALFEASEAILVALVFALFARTFVIQAFKIPSGSMEQNLLIGDHILVNKFIYGDGLELERRWGPMRPVQRGDVVVFRFPEDPSRDFIKRCVGLPGDSIELVDKQLVINGQEVDERAYLYLADGTTFPSGFARGPHGLRDNFGPYTVPEEQYFCLGDNRDDSNDSRFWGAVPAKYIKGRALMVYWSLAPHGSDAARTADAGEAASAGERSRFLWFFTDTRWQRSFRLVR